MCTDTTEEQLMKKIFPCLTILMFDR